MKSITLIGFGILIVMGTARGAEIASIDAKNQGNETLIQIKGAGLTGFVKEEKTSPPELVLTFTDSTLAESIKSKLDVAGLGTGLIQVSTYPLSDGKVRIVTDFQSAMKYTIESKEDQITIRVPSSKAKAASATKISMKAADDDALTTIMSAETEAKFTGSPITLKLKNADVHEVLRLISEASGFNIIIHPSVSGMLTLSLENVPWDQALDVVLSTLKLGAERNESVLRVMPREMLVKEKQDELDSKKLSTQSAPRITRVFPISYADLGQLSSLLLNYANSQNNAPGASGVPATILVDQNTQSLVIRDTAENVERIRKMIQILDVQTPQVLIEGKVVEASENFQKDLEGGVTLKGPGYGVSVNDIAAVAGSTSSTSTASAATSLGGSRANSINLNIAKTLVLNATLTYSEKQSHIKIVSSPKTVVLSGKPAEISQATTVCIPSTVSTASGSSTNCQPIEAVTKLNVTPRVTNDGSVFMKLTLNRDVLNLDDPTKPTKNPRAMNTEVIVESGNTLVIGGVLNVDDVGSEQGIPLLRKLPIVGWLFGSEITNHSKSEVMFFVTPRIMNQKKTSIGLQQEEGSKL